MKPNKQCYTHTHRIFPDVQIPRAERVGVTVTHKSTKAFADPNNNNRWQNLVLDPSSNIVLTWNRVFLISCLFALFIDPFFYFIPLFVSTSSLSCVGKDNRLSITITVMRSLADFFYMFNIAVKFNTAYVRPNSRVLGKGDLVTNPNQIRRHYIRSPDFVRDILAAVPVPQILLWGVMPAISASDYNVKNTTFGIILVFQYAFRMYLIVPLSNKIIKSAGVVANTAWGGAAYNLLLYMLASHVQKKTTHSFFFSLLFSLDYLSFIIINIVLVADHWCHILSTHSGEANHLLEPNLLIRKKHNRM